MSFESEATAAGVSPAMLEFFRKHFALKGHEHPAADIIADPSDGETQEQFNERVSEALATLPEVEEEGEEVVDQD